MKDYPPFEQAIERLRYFLKSEDLPEDIVWVNPDDAALIPPQLFIRLPEPETAWKRASSDYQRGCHRGLGVMLGALCRIESGVCCFAYLPRDEDESARHLMPDGLKLTHPVPVPNAQIVGNRLAWLYIKWLSLRWHSRKVSLFHRE